jgi:phosphoribosylformimino-5-aminoimidazole carboxamide ribotide isomerase
LVSALKVIPVLDILNGITVHAIKGQRSQYQPLQSNLTQSTDPIEVAKTFKKLGFNQLYIADLDAIIDCRTSFGDLKLVTEESGLELMVDAGITNLERAQALLYNGVQTLIIGTETLQNKTFVAEAIKQFGSKRVLLSLDLKDGKVLVGKGFDGSTQPFEILAEFKSVGLSQVVVLDLSRVGSGEGVDLNFLKQIKDTLGFDVYVGGGVRGIDDLVELEKIGISGALIATSLHTGKIGVSELKEKGFL